MKYTDFCLEMSSACDYSERENYENYEDYEKWVMDRTYMQEIELYSDEPNVRSFAIETALGQADVIDSRVTLYLGATNPLVCCANTGTPLFELVRVAER